MRSFLPILQTIGAITVLNILGWGIKDSGDFSRFDQRLEKTEIKVETLTQKIRSVPL